MADPNFIQQAMAMMPMMMQQRQGGTGNYTLFLFFKQCFAGAMPQMTPQMMQSMMSAFTGSAPASAGQMPPLNPSMFDP